MYQSDREFTDFVHKNVAIPVIYEKSKLTLKQNNSNYHTQRDNQDGIDYVAEDEKGFKVTIQERFREDIAASYNDFTIRYTRENSKNENERKSEFFKIDATYFLYGVVDCKKKDIHKQRITGFLKYIIIDVNALKNLFRQGILKVPEKFNTPSEIKIIEGKEVLVVEKKKNKDGSSEFLAINPALLFKLIGLKIDRVVMSQFGFY